MGHGVQKLAREIMQRGINSSAMSMSNVMAADLEIMTHGLGKALINVCVRRTL